MILHTAKYNLKSDFADPEDLVGSYRKKLNAKIKYISNFIGTTNLFDPVKTGKRLAEGNCSHIPSKTML